MNDIEYFAKIVPQPLTTHDEDMKAWRAEMQADDLQRELRRSGKLPVPETTYERFPEVD